jgi:hypothetical protein
MRVMGIRFVDVLGRSDRRQHEARHRYESNSRAPRRMHDAVDYGSPNEGPSNTSAGHRSHEALEAKHLILNSNVSRFGDIREDAIDQMRGAFGHPAPS